MPGWTRILKLDEKREVVAGSAAALCDAIRSGADLRIGTAFRHNEHIDITSANSELIREVMDFRVTYLLEDRWAAGIQNLRMPIALPDGFGPRASMSFFLYNQDGHQGIGRPFLDGKPATGTVGPAPLNDHAGMPKYHELANWDVDTNAPSSNFIYDFEYFEFHVRDSWREVFAHDADGQVISGDLDTLADSIHQGSEVKIAVRGLCDDLAPSSAAALDHEVFLHLGACYFYTETRQLMASANPVVRTRPAIPLGYAGNEWDFGWVMPRTDGHVARWLCNPQTLRFQKSTARHAIRWFVDA